MNVNILEIIFDGEAFNTNSLKQYAVIRNGFLSFRNNFTIDVSSVYQQINI
jgi:hypothetical protein